MRRISFVAALAAVVASPLSAQTWQTIGVASNSNTGAYWNNTSDDNVGSVACNVGAILTNSAIPTAACINQAPTYLPLNPAPLTTIDSYLNFSASESVVNGFGFNCAGACSVNLLGRVAGASSTTWGAVTSTGVVFTSAQLAMGQTVSGPFALWISQALPLAGAGTIFTSGQQTFDGMSFSSNQNQQFAVFSATQGAISSGPFGSMIAVEMGSTYFVGMEDNVNGGRGFGASGPGRVSDRDYNDILVSVQAVPEPATVGLMGLGLLALAGIAKRRKA